VTSATPDSKLVVLTSSLLLARAGFWPLQNLGWLAFFLVHWLSGVAHNKSPDYIGMSITMAITGWCVTLMLHRVFTRLWQRPLAQLVPAVLPWFALAVAIMTLVNVRATNSFCLECKPNHWWGYLTYSGFASYVLLSWSGLPKKPAPLSPENTLGGVGLRNTAERLQTLYGAAHTLRFGPREDGGFTVQIRLPFEPSA
jgi:hypothetical protein